MYPIPPGKIKSESEHIKKILLSETRFGLGEFNDLEDYEILERNEFREIKFLKSLQKRFAEQLGTSGHGNHFVDVGVVEINEYSELVKLQPDEYFAVLSHRITSYNVCYTKLLRYRKRFQTCDLTGQIALITGSRLKIGYHAT